jgi:DNA segregation ATPase FtsK/SpoIIIE-like protein
VTRLVQRGRKAGIHVIGVTQKPAAAILTTIMRANFPLRLVGRVTDASEAHVASGRAGTNAHLLAGRGDFLAVGTTITRFQVPHVSNIVFEQEIRAHFREQMMRVQAPILESAPPAQTGIISQAEADADTLITRAEMEERLWKSQNEAERWLCGYNGGGATSRTRAALAVIEQRRSDSAQVEQTMRKLMQQPPLLGIKGVAA